MTKTKGLLLGVLVSTFLFSSAFAQQPEFRDLSIKPDESKEVAQPEINIYPVPIERFATISFNNLGDQNWGILSVQLINILGNIEEEFSLDEFTVDNEVAPRIYKLIVDFAPHQAGVYFFKVIYTNVKKQRKHETTRKVTFNG